MSPLAEWCRITVFLELTKQIDKKAIIELDLRVMGAEDLLSAWLSCEQ